MKPGDTSGVSVWYSIEALLSGLEVDFAHIAVLQISSIENIGLQVQQSGNNPMHADITFPREDLGNKDKMRIYYEKLAYIAAVVKQSEWVGLAVQQHPNA